MPDQPSPARQLIGDFAPKLLELTDDVLFGDVWERPGLSKRDRSLITVAALVALYRTDQLPGHLRRAVDNGVTDDELIEAITHLAFYSGWPTAMTAIMTAKHLFGPAGEQDTHWSGVGRCRQVRSRRNDRRRGRTRSPRVSGSATRRERLRAVRPRSRASRAYVR